MTARPIIPDTPCLRTEALPGVFVVEPLRVVMTPVDVLRLVVSKRVAIRRERGLRA